MAGIIRSTQAIFAESGNVGSDGFGAAADGNTGTDLATDVTVEDIQTSTAGAWTGGWLGATLGASKFPALEDMNAVLYVITSQLAYLLERGMAEYDAGTEYNTGDIAKGVGTSIVYKSIANANTGNSLANPSFWLECGDLTNLSSGTVPQPMLQAISGANHSFVSGDNGLFTKRSNAGSAMADTLPGTGAPLANGWFAFVQNVDATGADVIGVGAGGTINQGNLTGSIIIMPGETWAIYSQGVGVYNAFRLAGAVLAAPPTKSSFKNLSSAWASTTTVTMAADEVMVEDASGNTRRLSAFSKTVNSAASGAGGLDTGSIANATFYYIYAIFNPSTNTQNILMSASATAPTLPSGYTFASGPLSVALTDGSAHFLGFTQKGKKWQYQVGNNLTSNPPSLFSGAQGTIGSAWAAISMAGAAPLSICASVSVILSTTSGSTNYAILAPNSSWLVSANGICWINGVTGDSKTVEFVPESNNMYIQSQVNTVSYMLGFELNI